MGTTRFGFWPRQWRVVALDLLVEVLPTNLDVVQSISSNARVFRGWIHPPLVPASLGEPSPDIPEAFSLPPTHQLAAAAGWMNDEFANFIIAFLGLIDGMRLIPEGWVHFYKTPIEPTKIGDIACDQREASKALGLASDWWRRANSESRSLAFGAIHWYCFTASYEHEFERFAGLYTVLDTLYRVYLLQGGKVISHARRPELLATRFRIPVPSWAIVRKNGCDLSLLRNELIHEARFGGKPIGFGFPTGSIMLEFGAFVSRLIVATVGVECDYIHTSAQTMQMHGLDIP
jgi:hypothetical protein